MSSITRVSTLHKVMIVVSAFLIVVRFSVSVTSLLSASCFAAILGVVSVGIMAVILVAIRNYAIASSALSGVEVTHRWSVARLFMFFALVYSFTDVFIDMSLGNQFGMYFSLTLTAAILTTMYLDWKYASKRI